MIHHRDTDNTHNGQIDYEYTYALPWNDQTFYTIGEGIASAHTKISSICILNVLSNYSKTNRLRHIYFFFQISMQKSSFYIELYKHKIKLSNQSQQNSNGIMFYCRWENFIVINVLPGEKISL